VPKTEPLLREKANAPPKRAPARHGFLCKKKKGCLTARRRTQLLKSRQATAFIHRGKGEGGDPIYTKKGGVPHLYEGKGDKSAPARRKKGRKSHKQEGNENRLHHLYFTEKKKKESCQGRAARKGARASQTKKHSERGKEKKQP